MPKAKTGSKKGLVKLWCRIILLQDADPTTIQDGADEVGLDPILESLEDDEAKEVFPPSQSQRQMTEEQ